MRRLTSAVAAAALAAAPATARAQFPPELRGRVVDSASGTPVAGARVEPADGGERALSGVDGTFMVRGLEPGARAVRVAAPGFRPATVRAELANGRVTRVVVALARAARRLDPVRVTAAGGGPPPGALVLDRAAIVRAQARELGELLQGEAGLVVTRRGGAGAPATLSVRGASAGQLLVLVDGVPVNDPLTNAADLSTVPLEMVERVTVLRGAESARYGPGALAGVVAVETRRAGPADVALRAGAGAYGERVAGGSAGGRAAAGTLSLGGRIGGEFAASRNGFAFPLPDFRGGGRAVRRNADARLASALATGTAARGDAELRARADLLDVDRGMPGFATQPSEGARQRQRRLGAALAARRTRGRWDAGADLAVQRQEARHADPAPPSGGAYSDSTRVTTVRAAAAAGVRGRASAAQAGGELRELRVRSTQLAAGAPASQRLAGAWVDARVWRERAPGGARAELFGALRADDGTRLRRPALSPRVGVSLGGARAAARLTWGNAFSPPALADQFLQEGVRTRANPALAPERVRGEVELAADLRALALGPATVSASAALYRADVRGMIIWAPNFRFEWRPENVDATRRGADASLQARFALAELELRASASRVAVEYDAPALAGQVVYRPRTTAAAGAGATLAGVRLDLGARYAGARRTVAGSPLNALPAYGIADLRASRPFALGGWQAAVSLGIDDLLDAQPAMLVDFPSPGRAWRVALRVGAGRSDE